MDSVEWEKVISIMPLYTGNQMSCQDDGRDTYTSDNGII